MTRERNPFRIPQAGLASFDINANGGSFSGGEFVTESTLGGVVVYAIYQALLTALRTEALRKRGAIDRAVQIRMITSTVWESVKQGAAALAAGPGGDGQGLTGSVPCLLGWA